MKIINQYIQPKLDMPSGRPGHYSFAMFNNQTGRLHRYTGTNKEETYRDTFESNYQRNGYLSTSFQLEVYEDTTNTNS